VSAYRLLVHPSANRVYGAQAARLAVAELRALASLAGGGVDIAAVGEDVLAGVSYVAFETAALGPAELALLSNLSAALGLFEVAGPSLLSPIALSPLDRWDDDLVSIQRYPGKTNERFTKLLVNLAAVAAAGSAGLCEGARLTVLDPLCGRGTTLNQAVLYGFDAAGLDTDRRDVEAYTAFFTQWLQDKRAKHSVARGLGRGEWAVDFAPAKGERSQRVEVVVGDTSDAPAHFKGVDAVVADLPYGVQHGSAAGGQLSRSPLDLLHAALPAWLKALRPGGAVVLAWNLHVLDRAGLEQAVSAAGAELVVDPAVADFAHRVDRAVRRDVAVSRKP
jgi:SAM-dependent methyltransferase